MALTKVRASVLDIDVNELGFVPVTRRVNGYTLEQDVALTTLDTGGMTETAADAKYIKSTGDTDIVGNLSVTGEITATNITASTRIKSQGDIDVEGKLSVIGVIQTKANIIAYKSDIVIQGLVEALEQRVQYLEGG